MALAVVDFDKTLIRVDSTEVMLRDGFWHASLPIIWWGGWVFLVRMFLPYTGQVWVRRKFRYALFRKIYQRPDELIAKYADILAKEINEEVVKYIQANYDTVIVSSAAWKELLVAILQRKNIMGWTIQATEYNPDFAKFTTCWYEEKVRRLKVANFNEFDVFTDSEEDRPLIKAGKKVFLVTDGKITPYV